MLFFVCQHKFASNVVEKCFTHAAAKERMELIDQIIGRDNERITDNLSSPFLALVKDQYGNYVVQRMIDEANEEEREIVISRIRRHATNLKKVRPPHAHGQRQRRRTRYQLLLALSSPVMVVAVWSRCAVSFALLQIPYGCLILQKCEGKKS